MRAESRARIWHLEVMTNTPFCPSAVWGDWHTRCMTGIAGSDAFCYFGFPAITTWVRVTLSFHTDPSAYQGSLDVYKRCPEAPDARTAENCPAPR